MSPQDGSGDQTVVARRKDTEGEEEACNIKDMQYCMKIGHIKRYCDALAKSGVPIVVGGQKLMQSTYISSDSESISLILCHALIVSLYIYTSSKGPQDKWIYGTHTEMKFETYLAKERVRHELTVSKTPEQNGTAERMNRTLVESVQDRN